MMYEVVVISRSFKNVCCEARELLKENNCNVLELQDDDVPNAAELIKVLKNADGLIVSNININAEIIGSLEKMKVISKYGVGVDNIDIATAEKKGIAVMNTPGANTDAVADLAMGLIISIARHIPQANYSLKSGKWGTFLGHAVGGSVLGIFGLGKIGQALAQRAAGFKMRIMYSDQERIATAEKSLGCVYAQKEEIIKQADFISLHMPLSAETQNFIGKEELTMMKKTAYIINTARGPLIDETALYNALKTEQIAGAALDVFSNTLDKVQPLFELPNIITVPHMGAYTYEALKRTGMAAAKNIIAVLQGKRKVSDIT